MQGAGSRPGCDLNAAGATPHNMARSTGFSIPLYRDGESIWRQGLDAGPFAGTRI